MSDIAYLVNLAKLPLSTAADKSSVCTAWSIILSALTAAITDNV